MLATEVECDLSWHAVALAKAASALLRIYAASPPLLPSSSERPIHPAPFEARARWNAISERVGIVRRQRRPLILASPSERPIHLVKPRGGYSSNCCLSVRLAL